MLSKHLISSLFVIGVFFGASVAHAYIYTPDPYSGGGTGYNNNTVPPIYTVTTTPLTYADIISPRTYAILIGSEAPSNGVVNALRGDLDVDNVAAQLSWATEIFKFKYNWMGPNTIAGDIGFAASSIASRAKPGDSFIFYYSGHGVGGSGYGVQDYLNPVQKGLFQDNSLASVFSGSTFDSLKKFFIIDSCHAEGIWKNDTVADRDLETLKNISFIGSSSEDGLAYTAPESDGTSYFTNAILSSLTPDATFSSILTSAASAGGEVSGFAKGGGPVAGTWQSFGATSADFDLGSSLGQPVPEPSSMILLFAGLATPLIWRLRRK
jgi:hypothetical protein